MALVITPTEASKELRISPNEMYRLLETGTVPAYRDRGYWKIPVATLEMYVAQRAITEAKERREQ